MDCMESRFGEMPWTPCEFSVDNLERILFRALEDKSTESMGSKPTGPRRVNPMERMGLMGPMGSIKRWVVSVGGPPKFAHSKCSSTRHNSHDFVLGSLLALLLHRSLGVSSF